jgi:hypothetical protein
MNYLICLFLSLIFFAPTFAQSPVPIEKEPRHRLKFSNQYVRVFHVVIPPGDKSLFHTHLSDGLSVRLADASIRDEVLGGAAEDISVKRGEVTFGYRPGPLTHRVTCTSNTPFRNIFIEVLSSAGIQRAAPLRALVAGQVLVLENARVRMSRLVLAPGQSIELAQALPGLRVAVSEGRLDIEVPGEKGRTLKFQPGDTQWHEGAKKQVLRNVGSALFEAVEIELK